jgi:hypothetical protein
MSKKKTSSKTAKKTYHRSAKTGRFVSKEQANKYPKTTVKESDKDKDGTDHTGPRRK